MVDRLGAALAERPARRGRERIRVEHRLGGLDRRSFRPALVVVAIWLLWVVAVPHLDAAVEHDDQVRPGDRFAIGDDLAVTPPPGWNVVAGFRTDDVPATGSGDQVAFNNGTTSVAVKTDDFSGTPDDLLDQVDKVTSATGAVDSFTVAEGRATVTTASGLTGVSETYTGHGVAGTIAAFVTDGTGIQVQVAGQPGQDTASARQVAQMIDSIGAWNASDTTTEDNS